MPSTPHSTPTTTPSKAVKRSLLYFIVLLSVHSECPLLKSSYLRLCLSAWVFLTFTRDTLEETQADTSG